MTDIKDQNDSTYYLEDDDISTSENTECSLNPIISLFILATLLGIFILLVHYSFNAAVWIEKLIRH